MTRRPANAPPPDTPLRRRVKLAVFILILGPMVLFLLYHMARGAYKIVKGEPVGYEQRDRRSGEIR